MIVTNHKIVKLKIFVFMQKIKMLLNKNFSHILF